MTHKRGEDEGEGSDRVNTEGEKGTFWLIEIVESVVDEDGGGSSMVAR